MELWICGKWISGDSISGVVWEYQGVFFSKTKAVSACKNRNYFIAPANIDKEIPDETVAWVGLEYPLA